MSEQSLVRSQTMCGVDTHAHRARNVVPAQEGASVARHDACAAELRLSSDWTTRSRKPPRQVPPLCRTSKSFAGAPPLACACGRSTMNRMSLVRALTTPAAAPRTRSPPPAPSPPTPSRRAPRRSVSRRRRHDPRRRNEREGDAGRRDARPDVRRAGVRTGHVATRPSANRRPRLRAASSRRAPERHQVRPEVDRALRERRPSRVG